MITQAIPSTPVSRSKISILSQVMSLYEDQPNSVLYRALVIHANVDDLGHGNGPESLKSGNSSAHIACGLISNVNLEEEKIEVDEKLAGCHHHHGHNCHQTINPSQNVNQRSVEMKPLKGLEDWLDFAKNRQTRQAPWRFWIDIERSHPQWYVELHLWRWVTFSKYFSSSITVWKVGRIYEYDYSGFISTGMMGISPMISGGSISGRLVVEPVDHNVINVAVSHNYK